MDERDSRALQIVEECLAFDDVDARAAAVTERTAGDHELAARVGRLLGLADRPFRLLGTEQFGVRPVAPMPVPPVIGPFRTVRTIGDGGMGTVVLAERDDGVFDQNVAIKLIRADINDSAARERFDSERRILAALDHPGIAHIIDGGEIDGRPWMAMEFVDGLPLTTALDQAGASQKRRLGAFLEVCDAIAFAHRNLVVHADIKPGNALMRADGSIKLVDFGIARLIVDLDTVESATPYPLTPGYAAPERAGGASPTVAGDVYSLGVLLNELLTGAIPGEPGSAPVSDLDLRAIVARACARDPALRYPDVAALVADIAAYREQYPVAARADAGMAYHAAKFVRRHRLGIVVTGLVIVTLSAAAAISTMLYFRAERARVEAEVRFMDVRALSRFLLFDLYDQLAASPGTVQARVQLAAKAQRYLDQLRRVPGAPVDLRLDSAIGYRRLALVQGVSGVSSLGDAAAARRSLDVAQSILDQIIAADPNNANALAERGWIDANRWTIGADTSDSIAINARAARYFDRVLALDPQSASALLGRLTTQRNRAYDLIWTKNQPKIAAAMLPGSLAALRSLRVPPNLHGEARRLEFAMLVGSGDAAYYAGDEKRSAEFYQEAETLAASEVASLATPSWLVAYGQAEWSLGSGQDDRRAGLATIRRGREAVERALSYGPDASAEKMLLVLLGQEANQLLALGDRAGALAVSNRGVALREDRVKRAPGEPLLARDLAVVLAAHSDIVTATGQRAAACAAARRGAAILDQLRAAGRLGAHDINVDIPKAARAVAAHCR